MDFLPEITATATSLSVARPTRSPPPPRPSAPTPNGRRSSSPVNTGARRGILGDSWEGHVPDSPVPRRDPAPRPFSPPEHALWRANLGAWMSRPLRRGRGPWDLRDEWGIKVKGGQKRGPCGWVGAVTGKIRRGLRGVKGGGKGSPAAGGMVGDEGEEEAAPFFASEMLGMRLGGGRKGSPRLPDSPYHAYPVDGTFIKSSSTLASYESRSPGPANLTPRSYRGTHLPNPHYPSASSHFAAITARLQEELDQGRLDEDVLDFRFAGAAGNQEEGVEALFYPGSDVGSCAGQGRSSLEERLAEVGRWGPEWARGEVGQLSMSGVEEED